MNNFCLLIDHQTLIILALSFHPLEDIVIDFEATNFATFVAKEIKCKEWHFKSFWYFILFFPSRARNPINFFIFYYLIFFWSSAEPNTFFAHSLKSLAKEKKSSSRRLSCFSHILYMIRQQWRWWWWIWAVEGGRRNTLECL